MLSKVSRAIDLYRNNGSANLITGIHRYIQDNLTTPVFDKLIWYWGYYIVGPVVIRNIHGSNMQLDIRKKGVNFDLFRDGTREPASLEYYESVLVDIANRFEDIVVLDIGSNVGHFALLASKCCPHGSVHAIEPDPRNVEDLERNIELNNYENINVHQIGMGANTGTKTLRRNEKPNLNQINDINPDVSGYQDEISVRIETIDSLLKKIDPSESTPIILRMDNEGYETEIIKGAINLFESNQPIYTFIELHYGPVDDDEMSSMIDQLESSGLYVDQIRDDDGRRANPIGYEWNIVRPPHNFERYWSNSLHLFAGRGIYK